MLELTDVRLQPHTPPMNAMLGGGEIHVVLGANRSGKTLLARCLAGLASCASGTVRLDGTDITRLDAGRRPVALVNQAFVNYPAWTVRDNLVSPLHARGVSRAERQHRAMQLARQLGLQALLHRYPHELSGGQQQRLAIGRALAKDARVLVMDEPLVNLDYKLRESLREELRGLLAETGAVVVYTTTDPGDAFSLASHVVLFAGHAIVQTGAPMDVYRHPVNFVAAALMSEPTVNRHQVRGEVWALRPEHVRLARPKDAPAREFGLRVEEVETNGAHTFVHGSVHEESWVVKLDGMAALPPGEQVPVYARERDILRFPNGAG
ncbi:MAG: ABC transporter ATP-binding protein [Pseudomonadales bacterium]|nr:ABC transporter ATP-binding protein [Pseudomonadales bacterium]MCP5184009.1 ABC transporter ATP-binding protein [Pseudomonadales bacterium]